MTVNCTETWIIGGMGAHCVITVSDTSAIYRQAQLNAPTIWKIRKENLSSFVQVTNSVAVYNLGIRQVEGCTPIVY